MRDLQLVNGETGEGFAVEFLAVDPIFERVFLFYKPSLERLGITMTVRTVDAAQYENRLRSGDFDIITFSWRETQLPGNELRDYFGSEAADQSGSDNVVGIKNPAVDAMIERVVLAKSYDDLAAAAKALDRILLWNNYVVPHGASTSCAPRAGIGSAIPIRCRNTAHPNSRGCGGGTPTKRPRLEVPRPSFSKLESYQATWAGFVGPGVDGGMAIDILDAGYDALLEFVL